MILRVAGKVAWVEAKLYLRDPLTLVFTLAFPLIMLFVLAGVFGNEPDAGGEQVVYRGRGAIDFYVPAYVGLVAAAVGLVSLPAHLASYRDAGVLRRFRASGMSVWSLIIAELVVAISLMMLGAALVMLCSAIAYSNAPPRAWAGVLVVFLLVALAFATIGFLIGAVLPNARAAQGAGAVLFFMMMLLSGAGPPPEVMTGAMRVIADLLPLTHAVRLLQDPWLGFPFEWQAAAILVGVLVAAAALAWRLLRWE